MTKAPYQYDCSSRLTVKSPISIGRTGIASPMPSTSKKTTTRMNGSAGGRCLGRCRSGNALSRAIGGRKWPPERREQPRVPHLPDEGPQRAPRQYRGSTARGEPHLPTKHDKAIGARSSYGGHFI